MANGGFSDYKVPLVRSEAIGAVAAQAVALSTSEVLLRSMHKSMDQTTLTLKPYMVRENNSIPGTRTTSTKGKESREENVLKAVNEVPWLFKYNATTKDYNKLNIDVGKFESVMDALGAEHFGTSEDWGNIWPYMDRPKTDAFLEGNLEDAFAGSDRTLGPIMSEYVYLPGLREYVDKPDARKPELVKSYIDLVENHGVSQPGFGDGWFSIKVQYYTKYDIAGRLYGIGPHLARLPSDARSAVGGQRFYDFDQQLAHATLMLHHSLRVCGKTANMGTFPVFRKYRQNYKKWRTFLEVYCDMSPKAANKSLQKVLYGGKPDVDLPFLWALWGEVQAAGQVLLGSQEFEYLRDMFGQRPFPHATRLFYALSSFEDEALSHFITDFKDTFPTGNVNSLIYDGCICLLPADADEADVGALVTMVSDLSAVNWSVAKI